MKITRAKYNDGFLEFETSFGNGIAKCKDMFLNQECFYDAEMDIDLDIELGVNAEISSDPTLYLKREADCNFINCLVESVDDTNEICLRLSQSCIIIAYVAGGLNAGDIILIRIDKQDLRLTIVGWPS